jgi:hypothetical protein
MRAIVALPYAASEAAGALRTYTHTYTRARAHTRAWIVNEPAASFLGADDNLSAGPARCGPTNLEPTGFQEREPLDLPAGVINCTSFN